MSLSPEHQGTVPDSTDGVAEYIKGRIRRGLLVSGQRLVEADLIKHTGASRSRVREALRQLAAEGIVTIEEFRGAHVKRMTRAEVDQTYRAREVLEGLAARLFAELQPAAELQELQSLQARMNEAISNGDSEEYTALNEAWHALILVASKNVYARTFVERLRTPITRIQVFNKGAMNDSNATHRDVTQSILDADPENAERLMRKHIRHGLKRIARTADEFFDT